MRTMIEQDLGVDASTGAPLRRLHEVITEPDEHPGLDDGALEDLHAALVELERLDLPARQVAREHLSRTGLDADCPAASIRRAIYRVNRERVFQ